MPLNKLLIETLRKRGSRIADTASVLDNAQIEGPVDLAHGVTVYKDTFIGAYSYLNVAAVLYANSRLGRFCSVGRYCELGLAKHPTDSLSTHPFQYGGLAFPADADYTALRNAQWTSHEPTIIGADVWIGAKAGVVSGVKVGHGAVIGAGAIVTRDVPPYAIVGGAPARLIRMRFADPQIERLLNLQWWDMPLEQLRDLPFQNIEACLEVLEQRKFRIISEACPYIQKQVAIEETPVSIEKPSTKESS